MKLPNYQNAQVAKKKVTEYLLSTTHRDGQPKAVFFSKFGFQVDNWLELATALLQHAAHHEVAKEENSPFGKRYVIEGIMTTPDERGPNLRSVWFIHSDGDVPHLVTAYPLPRDDDD